MNRQKALRGGAVALMALAAAACSLDKQAMPALSGPSGLGLAITMVATPDQLPRDGSSQSVVTLTMRDAAGQTLANRRVALSVTLGVTLTQSEVVTGAGGQASFGVVAPTSDVVIDGNRIVLSAVPVGAGDGSNTTARIMTIGLTGPRNETAPTPSFDWTPNPLEIGQLATFDASKTEDEHKACLESCTYAWNFDDGATASGRIVTHAFAVSRPYNVALTVTDQAGVVATLRRIVVPAAPPVPTVDFTVVPAAPLVNQTTTFTANAKAAANHSVVRYEWSFGDGSTATTTAGIVDHAFATADTFAVTVRAIDDLGQVGSASKAVSVGSGLVASFTVSPTGPTTATNVNFNASGSTASNSATITQYTWVWGDGNADGSGVTATHNFTAKGTYVIRLTIVDSLGRTATVTQNLTVSAP